MENMTDKFGISVENGNEKKLVDFFDEGGGEQLCMGNTYVKQNYI